MMRANRRGYALIMTLLLIAIAGLALVGFSRLSLSKAREAIQNSRDLQERWGVASCQRIIFSQVESLLSQRRWNEDLGQWEIHAKPMATARILLGGQDFEMLIADESAKFDLNFMANNVRALDWKETIESVAVSKAFALELQPLEEAARRDVKEGAFESWDQVFGQDARSSPLAIMAATTNLTCWSSRLNFHSASDDVLREVCRVLVGDVTASRVVDARADSPVEPVESFLTSLALTARQQSRLGQIFTDEPASQSIWTRVSGKGRDRFFLAVREGIADSVVRYQTFQW